jgi:uncharacterized membrane protein
VREEPCEDAVPFSASKRSHRRVIPALLAAFLLGIVAGLRTFTAPAVFWLLRHGGIWAIVLAVAAVGEFAADLYPKAPPRTSTGALVARLIAGAFVGWMLVSAAGGSAIAGAVAGIAGAAIGAYGGLPVRLRAIGAIGPVGAGLLEDAVAIAVAVLVVTHAPA